MISYPVSSSFLRVFLVDDYMDNQNNFPYHFDSNTCKTCGGKCCRGFGGYVWISMEELEKMADTRKMDVALFSKQYVR